MRSELRSVHVKIGSEAFSAQFRSDLAPRSCGYLMSVLPYHGSVIHARWSGEAMWSPLREIVPEGFDLPQENPRHEPSPGEILLFVGGQSEPELLFPYGKSRFASVAGMLEGNPVLAIEDRLDVLARLGHETLWRGAMPLRIDL